MSCSRLLIASLALLALSCGGVATIPNPMWASPAGGSTAQEQAPATSPLPAPVEKRVLAVLELKSKLAGADAASVDVAYLSNVIRSRAVEQVPGLKVITRENMMVLVQASGKSLAECEGECEVDTGRLLGADLVISGDMLKFGTRFKLDLRMHDTKEGRLLGGAQASGRNADELDEDVARAVNKLLAPLGQIAPRPAPMAAPATAAPYSAPAPAAPNPNRPSYAVSAPPPPPAAAPAPPYAAQPGTGPVGVPVSPIPSGNFVPAGPDELLSIKCQSSTACFVLKACQEDRKKCGQGGIGFGYLQGAWDMPKDQRLGVGGFFMSCDAGNGLDCWFMAMKFSQGDGVPTDKPRALLLNRRGCELGEVHACSAFRESPKRPDRDLVDEILERLCAQENKDACKARVVVQPPAGTSMEPGTIGWALYTPCGGSTHCYLQRDCRDDRKKCGQLAGGYDRGQFDLETDKKLAVALYSAACEAGDSNSCFSVAMAYGEGSGVPKDTKLQLQMMHKACEQELAPACFTITTIKALPAEKSWAKDQLTKLCTEGDSAACSYSGSMKK